MTPEQMTYKTIIKELYERIYGLVEEQMKDAETIQSLSQEKFQLLKRIEELEKK